MTNDEKVEESLKRYAELLLLKTRVASEGVAGISEFFDLRAEELKSEVVAALTEAGYPLVESSTDFSSARQGPGWETKAQEKVNEESLAAGRRVFATICNRKFVGVIDSGLARMAAMTKL